jgi:hypothetical protein
VIVSVAACAGLAFGAAGAAAALDEDARHSPGDERSTAGRWHPRPGLTWQWQLDGRVDTTVRADVYDIDGFDASRRLVRRLHGLGRKAICYVDAGAWESWRPDAHRFPPEVLGKVNPEWPDQRWLDIRRIDLLGPIMVDRLRMCARKGFDGVELDEIDGYTNDTGFPLTAGHQLTYNRFLARQSRRLGLAAGLKNEVDQVRALVDWFDFAVNEQCFQFRECRALRPFIAARKAVFHVEYRVARERFCPRTTRLGFSSMRKHLDLRRWRRPCPPPR